jgi:hypothetical protein
MDWQNMTVIVALAGAVGFLTWRYFRRKSKPGACANCMAHQKLPLGKQPVTKR